MPKSLTVTPQTVCLLAGRSIEADQSGRHANVQPAVTSSFLSAVALTIVSGA